MLQTENFIQFNEQAAQTANSFWEKFQAVQVHLDRLSKYMSKSEFISLACKLKSADDDLLYEKVLAVSRRIESMQGQEEVVMVNDFPNPIAKMRFYFGANVFYATHFDTAAAVGWGCVNECEFEQGTIPREALTQDAFKIDFDFVPTSVFHAMNLEGGPK